MANNYIELSTAIPIENAEQRLWLEEQLSLVDVANEEEPCMRFLVSDPANEFGFTDLYDAGFECEFTDDQLWVHSENADPEKLALLMQLFLQEFNEGGHFQFAWAEYCAKPRLDEFGGGAAFVTENRIEFFNTYRWMLEQEMVFKDVRK